MDGDAVQQLNQALRSLDSIEILRELASRNPRSTGCSRARSCGNSLDAARCSTGRCKRLTEPKWPGSVPVL